MKPFIYNTIEDSSLEKEMNPSLFNETDSSYIYDSITVPRVTNILSTMLHEEYLMNWANFMGRVKHINHNDYTQEAAYIGTRVHHSIECFLLNKDDNRFDDIRDLEIKTACHNGFLSFMRWWSIISQHNHKVIFTEEPLVCPYYGGTLDLFLFIDGKKYIVDFKTSNHFNYKYHLQTAAYRRLLYYEYGFIVDGIIILKLSKKDISFEEQVLDLSDYNTLNYINQCDQTFQSLVYAYYNRSLVEQGYSVYS